MLQYPVAENVAFRVCLERGTPHLWCMPYCRADGIEIAQEDGLTSAVLAGVTGLALVTDGCGGDGWL